MEDKQYYGRKIIKDSGEVEYQLLIDHLLNVAVLTQNFSSEFTDPQIGYLAGILHDIGKYSDDFQRRIIYGDIQTDHSSAGAYVLSKIAKEKKSIIHGLLAYVVAGHHSGLLDYGNSERLGSCLYSRLQKCEPELFKPWEKEVKKIPDIDSRDIKIKLEAATVGFSLVMYCRFLFSCLIDADRTDAAEYVGEKRLIRNSQLSEMKQIYDKYISRFSLNEEAQSEINKIRNTILQNCIGAACCERGLFSLSVPTGGGKTIASMGFALKHATENGMKRIIYTIPFTSIIEQNAEVYATIFGRKNILEHHCNYVNPFISDEEQSLQAKMAAEKWDMPLIVTTNVQFFESLFSNRSGKLRKLHNIAGSVIVLDEAQAIPTEYIKPCMAGLHELVMNYGCSILLCTATQPCFDKNNLFPANVSIKEIIKNPKELESSLKRTEGVFIGEKSLDEVAELLRCEHQALCIVNTKRHAQELFAKMDGRECIHLSTNMYPLHRQRIIKLVREKLRAGDSFLVVSTQLVEAGVDIDFPVVFRSLAGVDSIIQAAGRCNREGKNSVGKVFVFEPEREYIGKGFLELTADLAKVVISNYPDFLSAAAAEAYFKELFDIKEKQLDKAFILKRCQESIQDRSNPIPRIEFESMAKDFHLIDEAGIPLVIPDDEKVWRLLKSAKFVSHLGGIAREVAHYSVNIRDHVLKNLIERGVVDTIEDTFFVLNNLQYYDPCVGLKTVENDCFNYIV